jgi:hypothetical protein
MLHPQAPKDQPWFWTITAVDHPPSVYNKGYSLTRGLDAWPGWQSGIRINHSDNLPGVRINPSHW